MYFVHERGVRMAVSNFCVFGGAFFTPVLVGVIADRIGYVWTFYFVAIFVGCMLPLVILFVPETSFKRESRFDIDTMGNLVAADGRALDVLTSDYPSRSTDQKPPATSSKPIPSTSPPHKPTIPPVFNGRFTNDPYLPLHLRPFPLFLHPGILFSCLIQGILIGFTVLIGIVLAGIMLGPPLWFGEVETGYMYTGAFIGALLGFLLTGLLSDSSAKLLTRWNNGVYEPEFRLVLVAPQLIFGGAGIIGFGWTSDNAERYGWFWPDFFFGMVVLGMVCGAVGSALYVVDAHRMFYSPISLTLLFLFKLGERLLMTEQATCPSSPLPAFSSSKTSSRLR
jgi:hypothetical protein